MHQTELSEKYNKGVLLMSEQVKKPIWKKWWFWLIIVVVVGFMANGGEESNPQATNVGSNSEVTKQQAPAQPKVETFKSGQYKVGTDLPSGEYVVIADGQAYLEVAKDATGELDSILVNDIFINRSIISVSDGQFLKVQNGTIYKFKDAPKVEIKNGMLPSGMYKVGIDFPSGEYKVISDGSDSYIEVCKSSKHTMNDIVSNDLFQGDKYIKVSDGQYLKFFNASVKVQ